MTKKMVRSKMVDGCNALNSKTEPSFAYQACRLPNALSCIQLSVARRHSVKLSLMVFNNSSMHSQPFTLDGRLVGPKNGPDLRHPT